MWSGAATAGPLNPHRPTCGQSPERAISLNFLRQLFRRGPEPESLSVRDFTDSYAQVVRAAHPDLFVDVVHGPTAAHTRVHWVGEDGFEVNQFMANWYHLYQQAPQRLDALHVEQLHQARSARSAAEVRDLALAAILPVIKTCAWQQAAGVRLDAAGVPAGERPLILPLAGDLVLVFMEETAESMNYLSPERLHALGMDARSVQTRALKNLAPRLARLQVETMVPDTPGNVRAVAQGTTALKSYPAASGDGSGGGPYAVRMDDSYGASAVLLFALWRDRLALAGEPLLMLPARDHLLVAGSRDEDGVRRLKAHGADVVASAAYPLSGSLFVWRDGRLQPFENFHQRGGA